MDGLTFEQAIRGLMNAGYDEQWARETVLHAYQSGRAEGRRYIVSHDDATGTFTVHLSK